MNNLAVMDEGETFVGVNSLGFKQTHSSSMERRLASHLLDTVL